MAQRATGRWCRGTSSGLLVDERNVHPADRAAARLQPNHCVLYLMEQHRGPVQLDERAEGAVPCVANWCKEGMPIWQKRRDGVGAGLATSSTMVHVMLASSIGKSGPDAVAGRWKCGTCHILSAESGEMR